MKLKHACYFLEPATLARVYAELKRAAGSEPERTTESGEILTLGYQEALIVFDVLHERIPHNAYYMVYAATAALDSEIADSDSEVAS